MFGIKEPWKTLAAVLICQLAGAIGSLATYPSIPTWYAGIKKPWFTPPNWVFAPVWITLFTMMGVAAYLVYEQGFGKKRVREALSVFGLQLILNTFWSILFFGLRAPLLAFFEIVFLWLAIVATILLFHRIDKKAAYLLLPYLAWVSFAALLNFYVGMLN